LKLRATRQPAVPAASLALALSTHAQGRDELALAPGSRRPPPHDSRPTALVSTPCAAPCEGKPVHGYAQTRLELEPITMVLPGVDLTVLRSVLSLLSWQRCQCTQSALLRLAYYRYPLSRGAYVAALADSAS
jgi:hypothetical protein